MFWISVIILVGFMFGVLVYTFFAKNFWLPCLALFFVICLVLGVSTLYLKLSISYHALLCFDLVGLILLVIALTCLKFSALKLPFLVTLISVTSVLLSILVALNFTAWENHYLEFDRNPQHLKEYISLDSTIWPEYLVYFPQTHLLQLSLFWR